MKKKLLFTLALITSLMSYAQPNVETKWISNITAIARTDTVPQKQVMVIDAQGASIVSGSLTKAFTFAGKSIDFLTNNASYIAKYSTDGAELWAVPIEGCSYISAITTDIENNVYVAGSFGEEISIGSTSGDPIEKQGGTDVINAFIAKYDANGVLLNTEIITPTVYDYGTDPFGDPIIALDAPRISITQLLIDENKLYVAFENAGGKLSLNGITMDAHYSLLWGMLVNLSVRSFVVCLNNESLQAERKIISAGLNENNDSESYFNVNLPQIGIKDNKLYFVASSISSFTVETATQSQEFTHYQKDNVNGYGYIIASVNLTDDALMTKLYEDTTTFSNNTYIGSINIIGDQLIVAGMYNTDRCPFDKELTYTGRFGDAVVASLDLQTFNTIWATTSGQDEGSKTNEFEEFNHMVASNNKIIILGNLYVDGAESSTQPKYRYYKNTYVMTLNPENGNITSTSLESAKTTIQTGITGNNEEVLFAAATPSEEKVTFTMKNAAYVALDKVENSNNSIYPISTVVTNVIQLSETANATITNLSGIVVKSVKATDQINVSNLPTGSYFITINGVTTKIQKI